MGASSRHGKKLNTQIWENLEGNAFENIKLRATRMWEFWNHLEILNG